MQENLPDVSTQRSISNDKWCFAWFATDAIFVGADRAALMRGAKWNQGEQISVSFLDGSDALRERVKRVALQWTEPGRANLTLVFREDTNNTDIRISFRYRGSWSTIGTTCRQVTELSQPTMNYGWLTQDSPDDEVHRVVLHEFGHALGLIHEHQNPSGGINWNYAQVIADLAGPPNNWSNEVIDLNMFQPYMKGQTNFTGLDPQSIMMYPIPS